MKWLVKLAPKPVGVRIASETDFKPDTLPILKISQVVSKPASITEKDKSRLRLLEAQ